MSLEVHNSLLKKVANEDALVREPLRKLFLQHCQSQGHFQPEQRFKDQVIGVRAAGEVKQRGVWL